MSGSEGASEPFAPYSRGPQPLGHGPVLVLGLLGTGLHSRR